MSNMNRCETSSDLTIDDLKYDEIRLILSNLSVRQLFSCLTVCQKWYQIITELLDSKKVLSLHFNDINHFTSEELNRKCDDWQHLAIESSVGRVIGKQNAMIAVFTTPSFQKIGQNFFELFDFCSNIQSLDLSQYCFRLSDIDTVFSRCPQLECLTITSDETNWTKFIEQKVLGLKHFSLSLTTKTPIYGIHETPLELNEYKNAIRLQDLTIINPQINAMNLKILTFYLGIMSTQLKKIHFLPNHKMSEFEALDLIHSLTPNGSNHSVKDFNLNVFVFDWLFDELNRSLPSIESLSLHFNIESKQNDSLKKLKNLRKLNLDFDSNVNIFSFEGLHSDSDKQFIDLLPNIPPTLQKLTIFDASLSLSAFMKTLTFLPKLQELELIYVFIENDCQQNFWQVISNFESLRRLTLNTTDIKDEGIEHLVNSESLEVLELVKYKGPSAQQTFIDSIKVIEAFGQLANLKPNKWFVLRLDIDVFEVSQDIKRLVPQNVRLINVGYKK